MEIKERKKERKKKGRKKFDASATISLNRFIRKGPCRAFSIKRRQLFPEEGRERPNRVAALNFKTGKFVRNYEEVEDEDKLGEFARY